LFDKKPIQDVFLAVMCIINRYPMGKLFHELDPIFHPRSVALLGASGKPGKIGRVLTDRFLETGFREFYPVNPGENEILGVRAYRSIRDIPAPVDLAIVLTPTDAVLSAVKDCAEKGVRAIVITSSGFGETGEKGKNLEREMVRIARESGCRIIGPNCVGIYCPSSSLPFPLSAKKESGSVGVVSQSGFFADYLTFAASENGVRFSKAVSCGNEADLDATDFLAYLGEDPETELIVAYLEGIKKGRRFLDLSREISGRKPIILWKGGRTEQGAQAAASHTGSLAGSRRIWEGALRQAGIISAKSFEDVLDCLYAFSSQPLPKGRRVGIISGPGGIAVGTTDACLELGLEVPSFSGQTLERLRQVMPVVGGSIRNPLDLSLASLVNPQVYIDALRILLREESVDMLLVIAVVGGEQLEDILQRAMGAGRVGKPIAVTIMAGGAQSAARDLPLLLERSIAAYPDAARAAGALARLAEYEEFRRQCGHRHDEPPVI
jgi:acyl-CoA synthetase (NDP forming)